MTAHRLLSSITPNFTWGSHSTRKWHQSEWRPHIPIRILYKPGAYLALFNLSTKTSRQSDLNTRSMVQQSHRSKWMCHLQLFFKRYHLLKKCLPSAHSRCPVQHRHNDNTTVKAIRAHCNVDGQGRLRIVAEWGIVTLGPHATAVGLVEIALSVCSIVAAKWSRKALFYIQ